VTLIVLLKTRRKKVEHLRRVGEGLHLSLLEVREKRLRNDLQRRPACKNGAASRASGSGNGMNLGLNCHRTALPAASAISLTVNI